MAVDIAAFTDLDAVADDAGDALGRARQRCLFDRLDWYRLLLEHCTPAGEPLIIRGRKGADTVWLFLCRRQQRATALANWYSLETGPVIDGKALPDIFEALALHLRVDQHLSAIELGPLREERLVAMLAPFRSAGWIARSSSMTSNWSIAIPGSDWSSYLARRPRRLQNTLKRKIRTTDLKIEIIDDFSYDTWQSYEKIYASSWKPEEGSPAFLRALATQEASAGTFRLGLAFSGETPVAAQFWLVENGEATIHKLAHVENRSRQSPGTVLMAAMFRHAIERDRVQRIDFGTGNDPYKADWMDQCRPLYRLSLFNPRTAVGLIGAVRESLSTVRSTIRRSP